MKNNEVIETIGSITKMEKLSALLTNTLENTLVLRSVDPFPGFRTQDDNPQRKKPDSLYIILRYRYAPEKINRINRDLSMGRLTGFFPSFGEIITRDAILPCIRIKGIKDYTEIPDIQQYFKNNDLKLMDFREFEGESRIKIFKTFKLTEIAEGLYRDLNDGAKIYFRLPRAINWKRLDYITRKIKSAENNPNFDAALGVIYRFCGPEDVIRIYDQDKTLERALHIRKLFTKEVKKDMLITSGMGL